MSDSMTTVFASLDDLAPAVGTYLGHSDWVEIDQSRIDQFAESTGDHPVSYTHLTLPTKA